MTDKPPTLRFAWWNTGLAPPYVASRATDEHRQAVANVVGELVAAEGCSLLGFCEVRGESILGWVPESGRAFWNEIRQDTGDRSDSDVGLLYDNRALLAVDHEWAGVRYSNSWIRAGLVVEFETLHAGAQCRLIVALTHLRTDARNHDDADVRRSRAAQALREAIVKVAVAGGDAQPALIVLGDFNVEPFSNVLHSSLPSSRARDVVRDHCREAKPDDLLLYNASFRLLGERAPFTGREISTLAGTYRTRDNPPLAWRTFDQVLVSGSFLETTGWALREDALMVWTNPDVFDASRSRPRQPHFDHLPLLGHIQWFDGVDQHGSH